MASSTRASTVIALIVWIVALRTRSDLVTDPPFDGRHRGRTVRPLDRESLVTTATDTDGDPGEDGRQPGFHHRENYPRVVEVALRRSSTASDRSAGHQNVTAWDCAKCSASDRRSTGWRSTTFAPCRPKTISSRPISRRSAAAAGSMRRFPAKPTPVPALRGIVRACIRI